MITRGIQVSCRVRHDVDTGVGHSSPCINVDSSARRIVVVHPSPSLSDGSNLASTRLEAESDNRGTAYSCFDGVYSSQSQEQVFESVGRPFVADLLSGYNCTIIAYGQTGSGKTYTIVGGRAPESLGLIPRAMETIFEEMARIDSSEYDGALTASFVEIYQEKLRDLLLPNSSRPLRLREDKEHDVRVEGASEISIASVAAGMAVLSRGNAQRSTGSTLMNADSSRSHSVFTLTFTKKHLASGTKVRGKLFIVDLAGSEKVQKTAATGVRMEEAKHINRSLSALGNVINALTDEKTKHVPYRDSKLTRLLQTSLGGNAKTHLLLTCSASIQHLEETLSTLRFGSRAKNIQNSPHVNNENAGAAAEYGELLTTLQNKIENLHNYIRQLETTRCEACQSRVSMLDIDSRTQQPQTKETMDNALTSDPVDEDPAHDTDESNLDENGSDLIADDLVRAEMQSLRKTLTSMMRDHEAQEHSHNVARTVMEDTEQQLDSRHRSQEQTIQQQELELQDASATIARLEKKMERLEESTRGMSAELHRFRGQQHQQQAGENAEAEILRRQLSASTKLAKQLQAKLAASQQEQEENTDLKERLLSKEHELRSLRSEMEVVRLKKLPVALPSTVAPGLPSPHRNPQTRPITAVEFKSLATANGASRGDAKHLNAGNSHIQNWWAGTVEELPARNQDENGAWHILEHVLPLPVSSKNSGGENGSSVNNKREDPLPPAENTANRVCSSASSSIRPFRARLVGLLNSLEEETTAYKELVVETKERTVSSGGSRPRRQLPCLDAAASNLPAPTTP
ncbi:hypothetical protein PHYPSEUDO_010376 [Phytophthora pseudosyringae]|uniref:Kinesin-like protein n=1 Tax=Phytophthora pseudosyringae TaxID=221518 RepID=A0A8T1W873_9STRA|nr:hypothetical protein PHYPSEUDO_010376 [Phytophthora pseudosyringae]